MSFERYANSSIGKKQMMALTGLMLIGFLLAHLTGNFLLFAGYGSHYEHGNAKIIEEQKKNENVKIDLKDLKKLDSSKTDIDEIPINQYALKLRSLGPILWIMRLGLLVIFVIHMYLFYQVITINKSARPTPYAMKASKGDASITSNAMHFTGILIFVYLLFHLADFTLHLLPNSPFIDGVDEGLYGLLINGFANPIRSGLYILAMIVLGMHISHALQSAFQTFGINHPRYTPIIKKASVGLGVVIALGYISLPVFVFIKHGLQIGAAQ